MLERLKTMNRGKWKRAAKLLLSYMLFYYSINAYTGWFSDLKLGSGQRLELMLIFYLFFVFQGIFKNRKYKMVLSALPVLGLYIIHDVVLGIYGRVPRLVEVKELPELVQAADTAMLAMFGLPALLVAGLVIIHIDRGKWRGFLLRGIPHHYRGQ